MVDRHVNFALEDSARRQLAPFGGFFNPAQRQRNFPRSMISSLGNRMFFSRLAWVLAMVTAGIMDEAFRARYVGRSPDQAVFDGTYEILSSVALGTLAKMSLAELR